MSEQQRRLPALGVEQRSHLDACHTPVGAGVVVTEQPRKGSVHGRSALFREDSRGTSLVTWQGTSTMKHDRFLASCLASCRQAGELARWSVEGSMRLPPAALFGADAAPLC